MKIAVDENIPMSVVTELKQQKNDVLDIRGAEDEGMEDELLWKKVKTEGRLFITTDKGFSQYREDDHFGIIIVTIKHPNSKKIFDRVFKALEQFDSWQNRLVVMRDTVQSVWPPINSN